MKNRETYMKVLFEFKDKNIIKIITGIRRCGKSTMLKLFALKLIDDGVPHENIIQMNFESMKFSEVADYIDLYNEVKNRINPKGKTYLILDEVQMVTLWQKAINSIQVDFDVDIYITGSNAYLLSSELSTLLSGRYVEIKMLPLSFKEFLDFNEFQPTVSIEEKFETYLKYGGMPAITEFGFSDLRIKDMLEGIYASVILKDVLARTNIGDQVMLRKIILFLADNIGNITSPNSIGNCLAHEGQIDEGKRRRNPASRTVESYILGCKMLLFFIVFNVMISRVETILKLFANIIL